MGILKQDRIIFPLALLFFSILAIYFVPESVFAQKNTPITAKTEGGLHTVTFDTPDGKIRINLPDDMAAGDTISGTVVAEPAGASVEERSGNSDELSGYVVEMEAGEKKLGGAKVGSGKLRRLSFPVDLSEGPAKITLTDSKGERVIVTDVPIRDSPHPLQYAAPPSSKDFKLPYIGRTGEPVQVMGPFDGSFDTTVVKIGGTEAEVLAESPRKVIARTPGGIAGSTKIEITERGVKSIGEFSVADVKIPAAEKSLDGIWKSKSEKSRWRISQDGPMVSAHLVEVAKEDEVRGYRTNAGGIRAELQGNLLTGEIQQFFEMPLKDCMAVCPSRCEQWNELMLILSEDGDTLEGQIQQKAIDTESCMVIEFGWRPWTISR